MAESSGKSSRSKAKAAAKPATPPPAPEPERKDTVYVVLRRVPLGHQPGIPVSETEVLGNATMAGLKHRGVWVPIMEPDETPGGDAYKLRMVEAPDADAAVEVVTGKGEGALVGDWKAVAFLNWKGVVTVEPPEQIMQDRRKVSTDE